MLGQGNRVPETSKTGRAPPGRRTPHLGLVTTGKERAFQFQSHGFKRHLGRGNPHEPEQGLDKQLQCNPWGVVKGRAASLLLSEVGLGGTSASHDATWTLPVTGESARSNSARSWNLALGLAERRHWQKREHCLRSRRTQDKMGERFSIFLKFLEVGRQEESQTLGKNNLSCKHGTGRLYSKRFFISQGCLED